MSNEGEEMMRDRIRTSDRKHPAYGELAYGIVYATRGDEPGRPCLDVVLDDGRRAFIRLAKDGSRLTDADAARQLARRLTELAEQLDRQG